MQIEVHYLAIFKGGGYTYFLSKEKLEEDRKYYREIEYLFEVRGGLINCNPITCLPEPIE